jgi:DNA-nicking Smr family endonuclease
MDKLCRKCNTTKPIMDFSKNQSQCKECKRNHYLNNKDKWLTWKENNKERVEENMVRWRSENKDKIKEYNALYNQTYKDKKHKAFNEWYKNNSTYYKDRYHNDENFRIKSILRTRINVALRGQLKEETSLNLLGCTVDDYKKYLSTMFDKNMSWDNYGTYWEIDHIVPCDSFDLSNLEEQKKCFHYTNTQPLTIPENRKKSNKSCIKNVMLKS